MVGGVSVGYGATRFRAEGRGLRDDPPRRSLGEAGFLSFQNVAEDERKVVLMRGSPSGVPMRELGQVRYS